MTRDEFVNRYTEIVGCALKYAEKSRREGLLALEEELDQAKMDERDIFEYGLRFVVDGTDAEIIETILSNIIKQEKDEDIIILNILRRCDMAIKMCEMYNTTSDYYLLKENCISFIEHFGYTNKYFDDDEIEIIIETDAAAISVAETTPLEISKKVIEYNHFILKGNILMKRDILTFIGNGIEPKRKKLEQINLNISNNLFFMLNNMNLRHNNTDKSSKYYNEFFAQMSKEQIEYWYDETYQLELLSLLLLANIERQKNIEELKKKKS
jgi:hypothetical protein